MGFAQVAVTPDGFERLRAELERLRTAGRAALGAELARAAEEPGELSENAAYLAAREDQLRLEQRIAQLESVLERAEVADGDLPDGVVALGRRVLLREAASGETAEYRVVGSPEVRAGESLLSSESPVGRAIAGRCKGDSVEVETPSGALTFEIVDVRAA